MSHDVIAYKPNAGDHTSMLIKLHNDSDNMTDEEWLEKYAEYVEATQVASLNRAAGNPFNKVIYHALDVYDEAYAGCSGNGSVLNLPMKRFLKAYKELAPSREKDFIKACILYMLTHNLSSLEVYFG